MDVIVFRLCPVKFIFLCGCQRNRPGFQIFYIERHKAALCFAGSCYFLHPFAICRIVGGQNVVFRCRYHKITICPAFFQRRCAVINAIFGEVIIDNLKCRLAIYNIISSRIVRNRNGSRTDIQIILVADGIFAGRNDRFFVFHRDRGHFFGSIVLVTFLRQLDDRVGYFCGKGNVDLKSMLISFTAAATLIHICTGLEIILTKL